MEGPEIIVFSTPTCPYCGMAKNYFKSKGLQFTEYDVSKDQRMAQEMVRITGQSAVPVIVVNGRVMIGFNRDGVEQALAKPKAPKREEIIGNLLYDLINL